MKFKNLPTKEKISRILKRVGTATIYIMMFGSFVSCGFVLTGKTETNLWERIWPMIVVFIIPFGRAVYEVCYIIKNGHMTPDTNHDADY